MIGRKIFLAISLGLSTLMPALATEPARIDAASEETANASYKRMFEALPQEDQTALIIAVLKLNLAGKSSAYEVAGDKSMQTFTAGRIKDRIAGMSSAEIIELSRTAPDVTTKVELEPRP